MNKKILYVYSLLILLIFQGFGCAHSAEQQPRKEEVQQREVLLKSFEIKAQQRFLYLVNHARKPEDITNVVDMDPDLARRILKERSRFDPRGFATMAHIHPIWEIPRLDLERLIRLISSRFYGNWRLLPYRLAFPSGGGPFSAAHSAMLHTGNVLLIPEGDDARTVIWDPADEATLQVDFPDVHATDFLFCSGHSFLSDGRLLVAGGGGNFVSGAINRAWLFDPDAGTNGIWTQTADDMSIARWYPTVAALGYPYSLVAAGVRGSPTTQTEILEVYNEELDTFERITGPPSSPDAADRLMPETYPGLHVLPDGRIVYTHTGFGHSFLASESNTEAAYLTLTGPTEGSWTEMTSPMHFPDRTEGMSVQIHKPNGRDTEYDARIAIFGGGTPATGGRSRVEYLETGALSAGSSWLLLSQEMQDPRFHSTSVLLPNGKMLLFGGAEHGDNGAGGGNLSVDIYDPDSNTLSRADSLRYARGYHTVTVLLPSGKVMVSGGISGELETTIEIYSPPYLFQGGVRPSISSVPHEVHHGQSFMISTPSAANIAAGGKVVLVKPMAFTHHTDTEQRVLELEFELSGSSLRAVAPKGIQNPWNGRPLAPRGYYMLFLFDSRGVPSTAEFVKLH